MAAYRIPLSFITLESGCFVPISHRLNQDGYFRYRWPWGPEMFHRTMWRVRRGPIPDGHEIDHRCGIRACCNIEHLQTLPRPEHLEMTNRARYASRKAAASAYWREHRPSGTALAEFFGVSFSMGCRWIREWKVA